MHELMRALNGGLNLDDTIASVGDGVVSEIGFGVAVISMVQPDGDLLVTAVAGDAEARATLMDTRSARHEWDRLLDIGANVGPSGHLRFIDHSREDAWTPDAVPSWIPTDMSAGSSVEDRSPWHPMDALFAPLVSASAGLLGVLSVDLPSDGHYPSEDKLGLLEVFAAQATIALEHARLHTELLEANDIARTALATRLQVLVDASPAAIIEIDRNGVVQHWSRSAEALLGYTADQVLGGPIPAILDRRFDVPSIFRFLERRTEIPPTEVVATRLDGSRVQIELRAGPTRDATGTAQGLIALLVDITSRKQLEQQLLEQATHDSLSGLGNRRLFDERLAGAVLLNQGLCAVVFVDLDRFKEVNDTLGHSYGDRLLVEVGVRLSSLIRPGDTLARVAGDEFAVLLTELRDRAEGRHRTRRMLDALHKPYELDGIQVDIEASIGLTFTTDRVESVEELVRQADVAMYDAKEHSRGVVEFDPNLSSPVPQRIALLGELRRALERRELVVHYQPQVDLLSLELTGLEALVRWQHPTRGLLTPAEFLDVAESTGLIVPLTLQVLDQACSQAAAWLSTDLAVPIAVNLSPRCFHDPELMEHIQRVLRRHGLPASQLKLEMTENALMKNSERAREVLEALASAGHELSLDDFGTGFSSLSHLRDLPATELKIDRSFVTEMSSKPHDELLVRSIIDLAHNLGLLVVAEGIEDERTLHTLRHLTCDIAQGYHVGRPMPASELRSWVGTRSG